MIKNITNIWRNPKERQAYAYILSLAIPMVIQNLFTAAVSSADVLMLNSVGQSAISAASLATQYSNILQNIFFGLGSGVAILCAQYWGKKDLKSIEKVQGIGLRFSLMATLLFALPSIFVPELMMQLYKQHLQTNQRRKHLQKKHRLLLLLLCWYIPLHQLQAL